MRFETEPGVRWKPWSAHYFTRRVLIKALIGFQLSAPILVAWWYRSLKSTLKHFILISCRYLLYFWSSQSSGKFQSFRSTKFRIFMIKISDAQAPGRFWSPFIENKVKIGCFGRIKRRTLSCSVLTFGLRLNTLALVSVLDLTWQP